MHSLARSRVVLLVLATVALVGHELAPLTHAANPLVPGVGMADPHVHVFPGCGAGGSTSADPIFWMYSTHDFAPNNTGFLMKDWRVYSSSDLVTWTRASTLLTSAVSWDTAPSECWATSAACINGTTFFYLSVGPTQIGVVSSTQGHAGPFTDPLGEPLVAAGSVPTQSRDPTAFYDPETDAYYLIFGTFNYFIARLADDMISFAEKPRPVVINSSLGPYGPGKTDDKPFMHYREGTYYLSWGAFYATNQGGSGDGGGGNGTAAAAVYGPFTYRDTVMNEASVAPDFRVGNASAVPWYGREDYADRHGSFFTHGGQWYWACNDRSHSNGVQPQYYRDTVMGYVHFNADGSMAPIEINATGVGQYDARPGWAVQAENYFELLQASEDTTVARKVAPCVLSQRSTCGARQSQRADAQHGFVVEGLGAFQHGAARLRYPNVHNVSVPRGHDAVSRLPDIVLHVANTDATAHTVIVDAEIRAQYARATASAQCHVPAAGDMAAGLVPVRCAWTAPRAHVLDDNRAVLDVTLTFPPASTAGAQGLQFDAFEFAFDR